MRIEAGSRDWVEDWSDCFSEFQPRFDLGKHRHCKQAKVAADKSWIRAVLGTRRSGKTEEFCLEALEVADQFPGEIVPYVMPRVMRDRDIVYQKMHDLSDKFRLGLQINRSEFKIRTPNGGCVQIYGLATIADAEKGRGKRFPLVIIDECFTAATEVRPIGRILRKISRPAPTRLIEIDGVVSTADHPYLTPEGWKRAEEVKPGDLLCVWEAGDPDHQEPAQDVLSGVSLGAMLEEYSVHGAAAEALSQREKPGAPRSGARAGDANRPQAFRGVPSPGEDCSAGPRASAEATRWQRPWAYLAGVDPGECHWLADEPHRGNGTAKEGRPTEPLQIGSRRPIGEVVSGSGWDEPSGALPERAGRAEGCLATWKRVDRVEVHERGGAGRYSEVCPDGRVYNLQTESGLYFAGGRLVHNCGAQNQEALKLAVRETFGPATSDFRGLGGRGLLLGGTPGYEPDCYWEQMIGGNAHKSKLGASVHFMTIWDNPFFKGREQMILDAFLRENNLPANDAGFRREWNGEFCANSEGLCYQRFNGLLLPRHLIPRGGYTVMGLDLGKHDPCAWVVIRFIIAESVLEDPVNGEVLRSIHHGHVIASYEKSDCGVDEMAAITRKLQEAYGVSHIAGDSAGLGATIVDELNKRYALPVVPVKKSPVKVGAIWMADSMFGAGTLHVHQGCSSLYRQLKSVPFDDKRLRHHPRFPDHSLDAMLYGLTLSRQHAIDTEIPAEPGTPKWYEEQQKRDEEAALEYARLRKMGLAA